MTDRRTRAADGEGTGAAACVALVARLHGLKVTPRQIAGLGAGWAGLEGMLAGIGMRGRLLTMSPGGEPLADVARAAPAVVTLRDGSCLVLAGFDQDEAGAIVTILDPASGDRATTMAREAFLALWTGEVLLLAPAAATVPLTGLDGRSLLRLAWQDPRTVRDLLLATGASALLAACAVLLARTFAGDAITVQTQDTLAVLLLCMALVVGFEWAFAAVRLRASRRIAGRVAAGLDRLVVERLLGLPLATLESTPAASLARSVAAAHAWPAAMVAAGTAVLLDGSVGLALFIVLGVTSPALALATAAVGVLAAPMLMLSTRRVRRRSAERDALHTTVDDHLAETIAGISAVKAMGLEDRGRRSWDRHAARLARADIDGGRAAGRLDLVATSWGWLLAIVPFAAGIVLTLSGWTTLSRADLFVVLLACGRMAASIRDLPRFTDTWARGRAAAAALGALETEREEPEGGRPGSRHRPRGGFSFAEVRYTYPGALVPALEAVSFEVPAGFVVGIMGRSGAGKSTLMRLLQRERRGYEGLIKLDGLDLRQYDLSGLRQSVMVLGDDGALLPGTLRSNLVAGRGVVSDEALQQAIRIVGLDAAVARLALGLDTVLSDSVPLLSDGERQRLAIARAVLARPAILALDEATGALDLAAEAALLASLRRAEPGQTLVLISQRLSSLSQADLILLLDRGELQDFGRHDELIARSDLYSGLWQRQAGHLRLAGRSQPLLPGGAR